MLDDAPLIETQDAQAPPGGRASWFSGAGGARLRAALWVPSGRPRGSVVLSGGRTEVIEKYYEVIGELLDRGFVVLAHDWRGQGLSHRDLGDELKGHARGYKTYLDDFRALLGAYQDQLPKPWVAVAHSMGGCLTLLAMAHGEDRFAGALLTAPMLSLRSPFPPAVSRVLTGVNMLAGQARRYALGGLVRPFDAPFEGNILTHDPIRYARSVGLLSAEPKLRLGAPTWGWIDFALRAAAYLARPDALRAVTAPVVILSAQEDALVDNAAQAAAARHLPQGKQVIVPGAHHEILMETDPMRDFFKKAFDALTGRVAPKPAEPPKVALATPPPPAPPAPAPAPTAKKPAVKPPAAKKPAARKPAGRKPGPKTSANRPAAAKAASTAAKKPAVKPAAAKKAPAAKAARSATAKKPVTAKKPRPATKAAVAKSAATAARTATKKPTTRKPAAKKPPAKTR